MYVFTKWKKNQITWLGKEFLLNIKEKTFIRFITLCKSKFTGFEIIIQTKNYDITNPR